MPPAGGRGGRELAGLPAAERLARARTDGYLCGVDKRPRSQRPTVPWDVESADGRAFEAAADHVLPAARAALEAGAAADPPLLAAARIAEWRALHGNPRGAVELLEPAAALAEGAELEDPFVAALLAEQLASVLQDVGRDTEAAAAASRAETLARRACGPGDPRLATLLANVGTLHKRRGDFITAEVHFRRALETLETPAARAADRPVLQPDALATLTGPIRLGLCDALRAQGKPDEALPVAERAARETEAALGPMHRGTVDALESLALARDEVGDVAAARTLWRRVAAAYAWNLGEGHPLARAARARAERQPDALEAADAPTAPDGTDAPAAPDGR